MKLIFLKPMGKQDQYLAAYGGFVVLEITRDGHVEVSNAKLSVSTIDQLKNNLMLFYTGTQRSNQKILKTTGQVNKEKKKKMSLIRSSPIKDSVLQNTRNFR